MSDLAISIQNLTKRYNLGRIGRHTFSDEVQHAWYKLRGKDPEAMMGKVQYNPGEGEIQPRVRRQDSFYALDNVSFDVSKGDTVGVVGTNGAGKSTLLKILSRITSPTEGEVHLEGRVGSLLEVGTGFHPELTGRENVYMNGTILGMKQKEIDLKYDDIVAFSEMQKFMGTPVKRYSSGMRVRLAFSVAAHLEPEILLVDEVLAVGDLSFQKKCLGKMQEVAGEGRTILFVSHNMAAVARLCNKGVVLQNGIKVFEGGADKAVSHYTAMSLSASSHRSWRKEDASGDFGFLLRSVGVMGRDGDIPTLLDVTRPYKILIGYELTVPDLAFRFRLELSAQGVCAFSVVEPREWARATGQHVAEVEIPANFLTEGEYLISVVALTSRGGKRMPLCRMMDCVAFQTMDAVDGESARGDYAEKMDGVLRPKLPWGYHEGEKDHRLFPE